MPTDPLDPEFQVDVPGVGAVPTQVPPAAAEFAQHTIEIPQRAFEASENLRLGGSYDPAPVLEGASLLGVGTPFAEAGALGVAGGRAAARALSEPGEAALVGLAKDYPKVGPPILKDAVTNKPITDKKLLKRADKLVESGEAYWGKQLTAEGKAVQKARTAAQKDIDLGNYTPFFKVSERSDVNPTRYAPYQSTADILPAKPETIKKYMTHATNPEGIARLQAAYEKGLTIPNSGNWYFLHQLEQEFIKEYGEQGPAMFQKRVADALAATTGGADPNANLMMAAYGNYLEARGEAVPGASHQFPFPVGGRYAAGNLEQYEKMLMPGGTGVTRENPKRYGFSAAMRGNPNAVVIDEQMSKLFDPKMAMPPPGTYGAYHQALDELAAANGVDPRYFQEVAWSGAKAMKDPSYKIAKPMIQEYNEAIERTSRITGVSPAEVVRRGIVRAEMPIYGAAGVIGAGVAAEQQQPMISGDVNSALGGGAETVQLAGDVVPFTGKPRPQSMQELEDAINKEVTQRTLTRALGGGAKVLPIKPED